MDLYLYLIPASDSGHLFLFSSTFLRYNRDYVVEGEPYAGYDRHNAEVAAFHLDRCVNNSPFSTAGNFFIYP